jgi:hypothetical protein
MLADRKIIATLSREDLEGSMAKGCLQAEVLSPLVWNLVLGKLMGPQ